MFGLKKKRIYSQLRIENCIGIILQDRNRFLNFGEIASKNVMFGVVIAESFNKDSEKLGFEFDILALALLLDVLRAENIPRDLIEKSKSNVFDNFELSNDDINHIEKRLDQYSSGTDLAEEMYKSLGGKLNEVQANLGIVDFSKQLQLITKNIKKFVANELA